MKTILFCLVISFLFFQGHATDYYSQGSASPNILSNWNVNPQGGDVVPASFANPGDRFIIQTGHTMITTAIWIVGGIGSVLEIQNTGTLQGNHTILFTGTFQIDDGGTYIHNNAGPVNESTGSSIFSGTESFAVNSHFEIRNWAGKNAGLPNAYPGISWGDLIINLQTDLSADGLPWNWNISDGTTLTIKGDLHIMASYVTNSSEIRFTGSGIQTINIDGNFLMSGSRTKVSIKSSSSQLVDGYTTMQVNGDIFLTGISQLELGVNTTFSNPFGLYELRFKGNFFSNSAAGVLFNSSRSACLVANGDSPQSFFHLWNLGSNFRVNQEATVNLASSLILYGSDQFLSISGTLNQNGYKITVNGKIEIAGGVFNASGVLNIGSKCIACSHLNGTYNNAANTWCAATGKKGRIIFAGSTVSLNPVDSATLLTAGNPAINSPGDIYFINSTVVSLSELPLVSAYQVYENSIFSLDANSYVAGDGAMYQGRGGTLRIGSADGLTAAGNTIAGNVRTGLTKDYNFSGTNSFEYFGPEPQVTGNGLPLNVDGTLIVNNSAGQGTSGVTLSQPVTVNGILDLTLGKLTTSLTNLLTLNSSATVNLHVWGSSYVVGPMKKIGSSSFTFPIGKGNNFAPLTITGTGLATDAYIGEYFMANPVAVIGSPFDNPPIDHLSVAEWWIVDRRAGTTARNVTLEATAYSNAISLSDLRILRWNGSAWKNEGNTGYLGISAGPVTSNAINSFSAAGTPTPFTFGSITSVTHPLPVNLISFDAIKLTNTKALLNWELAAFCSASAKFEIERANSNNIFSKIATVNGSGISLLYSSNDNDLKNGINYYRLKMIDPDGRITYSRTVAIMNGVNGLILTSLSPTIVNNTTTLTIASSKQQKIDLVIVDIQGRVMQKHSSTIAAGNTNIQLSTDRFAPGVYQLFGASSQEKTNIISFIKR
jgi:hypothetical protein